MWKMLAFGMIDAEGNYLTSELLTWKTPSQGTTSSPLRRFRPHRLQLPLLTYTLASRLKSRTKMVGTRKIVKWLWNAAMLGLVLK